MTFSLTKFCWPFHQIKLGRFCEISFSYIIKKRVNSTNLGYFGNSFAKFVYTAKLNFILLKKNLKKKAPGCDHAPIVALTKVPKNRISIQEKFPLEFEKSMIQCILFYFPSFCGIIHKTG